MEEKKIVGFLLEDFDLWPLQPSLDNASVGYSHFNVVESIFSQRRSVCLSIKQIQVFRVLLNPHIISRANENSPFIHNTISTLTMSLVIYRAKRFACGCIEIESLSVFFDFTLHLMFKKYSSQRLLHMIHQRQSTTKTSTWINMINIINIIIIIITILDVPRLDRAVAFRQFIVCSGKRI